MMIHREYTNHIHCIHSHSNPYNWPIHESDVRKEAFVVYFGFNNKNKAERFISKELRQKYPAITAEFRPAKRTNSYRYEVKVWGLPWAFVRDLIAKDLGWEEEVKAPAQPIEAAPYGRLEAI